MEQLKRFGRCQAFLVLGGEQLLQLVFRTNWGKFEQI